ncbi:MAG: hypothetical protein LC634_03145 [Sphingomonadales bacterium]|nr:hypothetical protein [Sphingomonadales bacterium]
MSDSALSLSALKARLAAYGAAPKEDGAERFGFGHDGLDNYLDGGLKRAQLHEIFADDAEDGGAAAGFAAMLGLCARPAGRPLLWLRTRKAEKRGGRFYAPGFIELGGDPDRLLLAIVADDLALLRGAGDALRCSGLGAVIAECRWSVRAAPSRALEARAPGPPMLDLTLLRRRGGAAGRSWRLEWDRERKRFAEPAREPAQEQTIPGAVVSVPAGQSPADRAPALAGTG